MSQVRDSRSRQQEHALLLQAFQSGVLVPEPLFYCDDATVLGRPFFVMHRLAGQATPHELVKAAHAQGGLPGLTRQLAEQLALIHRMDVAVLQLLGDDAGSASHLRRAASRLSQRLLARAVALPALEWGLRWILQQDWADEAPGVFCHRDFRTGNFLYDPVGWTLNGILDWEFAGIGDPHEDLGWFCARCWRFGSDRLEAGGVGSRASFVHAYERASGRKVDPRRLLAWEIMAHIRWALIALDQADRHLSGAESSLMLALTGARVPELEWEVLQMTAEHPCH
jgi:aminoglycoside phosphotransferase (APT) family kinase protein